MSISLRRNLSWLLSGGDVRDNPARVAPPDEPARKSRFGVATKRVTFESLSEQNQRCVIRDYMRNNPCQFGLYGEAITEHAKNTQIAAAFAVGDLEQFAKLADVAIREYVGAVIQREWIAEDAL